MDELLGVVPSSDSEGVLQDMHWSGGSFGYFPTYAIGTVYASQLFAQIKKDCVSFNSDVQKGDFSSVIKWLNDHVFSYGRLLTADEIVKNACGSGLNSKVFVKYLQDKYYELYEL